MCSIRFHSVVVMLERSSYSSVEREEQDLKQEIGNVESDIGYWVKAEKEANAKTTTKKRLVDLLEVEYDEAVKTMMAKAKALGRAAYEFEDREDKEQDIRSHREKAEERVGVLRKRLKVLEEAKAKSEEKKAEKKSEKTS